MEPWEPLALSLVNCQWSLVVDDGTWGCGLGLWAWVDVGGVDGDLRIVVCLAIKPCGCWVRGFEVYLPIQPPSTVRVSPWM